VEASKLIQHQAIGVIAFFVLKLIFAIDEERDFDHVRIMA